MRYSHLPDTARKLTVGLPLALAMSIACILMILTPGCKPTEKNYRAAYDVAREKRDRDLALQEELRKAMGLQGAGEMQQGEGDATESVIMGKKVWTRNMNFSRADSVRMYAVSVGSFGMGTNARAMASDLLTRGWSETKVAEGDGRSFVIIGSRNDFDDAMKLLNDFDDRYPKWQYVSQPGAMLIIGGSK